MTPHLSCPSADLRARLRKPSGFIPGLLLAVACAAPQVHAQTAAADDVDDAEFFELDAFVVTSGIRDSLAAGVDIKKESLQIVDAIVAEDIGKFPDNNVVEALQRVPGIQTTGRTRGEVNTVTIRGFNDIATTVNGRNIFTSAGRSVALADIPASLLYRVDIHKTRSASHLEQGIAGVIDVKTQRPFYFGDERTVIAARGIYSELADEYNPTVSALYTNTFETDYGRIGFLVNASYTRTNWTDKSITAGAQVPFVTENPPASLPFVPLERLFNDHPGIVEVPMWQPGLESGLPFAPGSTLPLTPGYIDEATGERIATGPTVETPYYLARDAVFTADFYGQRERPAVNAALQWAPNRNTTYTFEVFYNGYREDWQNNLQFSFADWWGNPGDFTLYEGTNIIKERTVGAPFMFMSGDKTVQSTDSFVYALNADWRIGDDLRITADLSYQASEFETEFQGIRTDRVPYNITVDFNDDDGVPGWSFGDNPDTPDVDESSLTDPTLWNVAEFYDNAGYDEGDAIEFKLDGTYEPGGIEFIRNIKFGIRLDERGAEAGDYIAADEINPETGVRFGDMVIGQPLADHPEWQRINRGYYDYRADIPTEAVVVDADYLHENAQEFREIVGYPSNPTPNKEWEITENTFSAYAQSDFRFEVGSSQAFSGQFGVRYVNVERDLTFIDDGSGVVTEGETSGDHFLPSAVLIYDLNANLRVRASYGQTLRYPAFADLNPNITYERDTTNIGYGTASGGNPDLEPTESENYDVSLEYYFGDTNLIYVTAFKRKIDGLVIDFANRVIYEDYPYILTQPDNASNGEMDGWEFGLVYFPENLPEWLDGIGVQASYTILDSSQDIPVQNDAGEVIGTDTTPFFAVSDSSYSVVLAYEKPRYSVRLSYVWRDDFLNNYEARQFANPLGIYYTPQKSLDMQISYNLTENWSITFDATNLTDEEFHSYYADPSQSHDFTQTHNFGNWLIGRTFAVGTRFSF